MKNQSEIIICQLHNLVEEYVNPNSEQKEKSSACRMCIGFYYGVKLVKQIKENNKLILQQFEKQSNQNSEILNTLIISLEEYKTKKIKQIDEIARIIKKQVEYIENDVKEFTTLLSIRQASNFQNIQDFHQKHIQNYIIFQNNINQLLLQLQDNNIINRLQGNLKICFLQNLQDNFQNEVFSKQLSSSDNLQNTQRYGYKLMQVLPIKSKQRFYSILFYQKTSQIIAGGELTIFVFQQNSNDMKQVQELSGHNSNVNCLVRMKHNLQFISGGADGTIIIWQLIDEKEWVKIYQLENTNSSIYALIINSRDDQIIQGGLDKQICFWNFIDHNWIVQQIIKFESIVISLSLNKSNNKLILSEQKKMLKIFEDKCSQWIIKQTIQFEVECLRICFLSDDEFVYQQFEVNKLGFFKYSQQKKQFIQNYEIEVINSGEDCFLFPMQFIESKNQLIAKNCQFVNIFRKQINGELIQDQQFEFDTHEIYGNASNDGELLFIWNQKNKQFEIQRLQAIKV